MVTIKVAVGVGAWVGVEVFTGVGVGVLVGFRVIDGSGVGMAVAVGVGVGVDSNKVTVRVLDSPAELSLAPVKRFNLRKYSPGPL